MLGNFAISFLGMSFLGQLLTSKSGNAVEPVMPAAATTRTPIATNGQLKVIGTQLCNEDGEPIQLKGLSSHGLQWFAGCLSSVSLNSLVTSFKADVFRIALYVQEGGYESDPVGFTNQVNQLIKETSDRGMYALVDWHILSPGDPTCNFDRARKFFTDIATANKGRNNLIYEIANEPSGVSWTTIKSYADRLIPIIRAIDPTSVILVGTPGWSSLGLSEGRNSHDIINAPINFPNIMYTFHFYAASHGDQYLNELDRASNSLPIFVSEFGIQEHTGDGQNDFAMADRYLDLLARKKISWTYWNFSDDFRSGAVLEPGSLSTGRWTDRHLKPSGTYIKNKIESGTLP
jgi:endoglucanase